MRKIFLFYSIFFYWATIANAQSNFADPEFSKNTDELTDISVLKTNYAINDSIYFWRWDTLSIGWKLSGRTINLLYNSNGDLLYQLSQGWADSIWVNSSQFIATWDNNYNPTNVIWIIWNDTTWINYSQDIYTYDISNNRLSNLYQKWNDTAWANMWLSTYTYNTNNYKESQLIQYWDGSNWIENSTYTYTYDINNNLVSELQQNNNNNQELYSYTYDANNFLTSNLIQHWNGTGWENNSLYSFLYDNNGNVIYRLLQDWHDSLWIDNRKYDLIYDANNNLTSELSQDWIDSLWYNNYIFNADYTNNHIQDRSSFLWQDTTDKFVSGDSAYYYFHTAFDLSDVIEPENLNIFPNPTSDNIILELADKSLIEIFNINSQLIKTINAEDIYINIDISGFANGMYFVKVKTEKGIFLKKFIKE
jgi:hypothetical protein